jgi:hypothetical protein
LFQQIAVVSRTRFNSNKNASQFSIGDDDDTASQADTLSGHSTRQTVKPSSRVLKPPGGGGSQITFG